MENRFHPGAEVVERLVRGLAPEPAAYARCLLTHGRVNAQADTRAADHLRAAATHLIRRDAPILPGHGGPNRLEVVVRGDEEGRLWWPDWRRSTGWKGGRMGRLAPPRNGCELLAMLDHPNPEIRRMGIESLPGVQATASGRSR